MAARRLSGRHLQRLRLPQRVHDQDRRLRALPRIRRHGAARRARRDHVALRRRLRHHRERRAPRSSPTTSSARSATWSPASGIGTAARHQRRLRPRLRPHPLQGPALHGRRLAPPHDWRDADVQAGRPLQEDAVGLPPDADRRPLDLRVPALQRLRQQVDDRPGRL